MPELNIPLPRPAEISSDFIDQNDDYGRPDSEHGSGRTDSPLLGSTAGTSSRSDSQEIEDTSRCCGSRCCKMRCNCGWRCVGITGMVVAVLTAVLVGTFPLIYNAVLNSELALKPGSIEYKIWNKSPVPMYIRFYLFNVTNAENVTKYKVKPILQELGPYTYREWHNRVDLEQHDNFTLKFEQQRVWQFAPELSDGKLDDMVTNINVPLISAAYTLRYQSRFLKTMFSNAINDFGETLFVTKNASQLLFDGYSDPLLDLGTLLPPGIVPPYDKFGWFYERNNSKWYDGEFNIFTGVDDISKLGLLDWWNKTQETKYYPSYCGRVNGSFGEMWPPHPQKDFIELYSTDLCRSIKLDFLEEVEDLGVTSYRYAGSSSLFANTSVNRDNWCFCQGSGPDDAVCPPSGLVNSSTCRYGAPAFVSFPHFYLGDPALLEDLEGLSPPEKDKHQFFVDLEPNLGVPTAVGARFQINILTEPVKGISIVKDIDRRYLPVLWFGVSANLNDNISFWLKFVVKLPYVCGIIFYVLFAVSLTVVAAAAIVYVRRLKVISQREEDSQRRIIDSNKDAVGC